MISEQNLFPTEQEKKIFIDCVYTAMSQPGSKYKIIIPVSNIYICCAVLSRSSCLTLCNPMDCSPPGSSVHGDSPDKNTGMGCHALLQRIFQTQELNRGLLHCKQILLPAELPRKPRYTHTHTHTQAEVSVRMLTKFLTVVISVGISL